MEEAIAQVRQQWRPVVQDVVAACGGDGAARAKLEPFLSEMGERDDWRALIAALRRILSGERDPESLLPGLDATDTIVVVDVLHELGVDLGEPSPPGPLSRAAGEGESTGEGVEMEAAIDRVREQFAPVVQAMAAACGGNRQAATGVDGLLDELAGQDNWRALAAALRRVLSGERDPGALLPDLDAVDTIVVLDVLRELGVEVGEPSPPGPLSRAAGEGESPIAQVRGQWGPVVQDVIASCAGDVDARERLMPFLEQMVEQDEWRALVRTLARILSGERDPDALLPGLDATDTIVVTDVLHELGVEIPSPPGPLSRAAGEGEEDGVSLDGFLEMVAQACRPDAPPGLAAELHTATRNMSLQEELPEAVRALGRVLNRILSGEHDPDLSALPTELAEAVQEMLVGLM